MEEGNKKGILPTLTTFFVCSRLYSFDDDKKRSADDSLLALLLSSDGDL